MLSKILSIVSLILFFLLMIIYPLKNLKINNLSGEFKNKVYYKLKKNHILIGGLFLIFSLIHGILAIKSGSVDGVKSGKISWIFILLMSLLIIFKNINKEKWMKIHRLMAIIAMILIIIHIGGVII